MKLLCKKTRFKEGVKRKNGFTLVETLVVIFIFMAMMSAVTMTMYAGQNSWDVNRVRIEMQQDLRIAMEVIKEDLRQASAGSIVNVPADDAWYTSIIYRIPQSVSDQGSITWPEDTTKLYLGGTGNMQLIKLIAEGEAHETSRVVSENIKTLKFKRLSTAEEIIEVSMTTEKKVGSGDMADLTFEFKVNLRN